MAPAVPCHRSVAGRRGRSLGGLSAAERSTTNHLRQLLAAFCENHSAFREAVRGDLVDENAVGSVQIRVIEAIIGTCIDGLSIAVRELPDLRVVERRKRRRFRGCRIGTPLLPEHQECNDEAEAKRRNGRLPLGSIRHGISFYLRMGASTENCPSIPAGTESPRRCAIRG